MSAGLAEPTSSSIYQMICANGGLKESLEGYLEVVAHLDWWYPVLRITITQPNHLRSCRVGLAAAQFERDIARAPSGFGVRGILVPIPGARISGFEDMHRDWRFARSMNSLGGAIALLTTVLAISYPTFAGKGAFEPSVCPGVNEIAEAIPKIDESGAFPGSPNYDLNERVLKLAKCYSQTGDRAAAKVVARALLRYADVIVSWPLIDREGRPQRKIDFTAWDLGGLWGGDWVYLDLRRSANLARAFEMISGDESIDRLSREFGIDVRTSIREKLLRYLVDYNLRFGRGKVLGTNTQEAAFPFSNMDPYRLQELIVFGRVVDPGYIHVAV